MIEVDFTGVSKTITINSGEEYLLKNVNILQNVSNYFCRFSYRPFSDENKGLQLTPNTMLVLGGKNVYIKAISMNVTIAVEGV